MTFAIPRLGVANGVVLQARGVAANTLDVSRVHVVISVPRTGTTLLDRTYSADDPSLTLNPDPTGDVAVTAEIQFPLPAGAAGETFSFLIEVLNSDGVVLYTLGPTAFQVGADGHSLGADGRPGPVEGQATYHGPGNTVTSVHIQPRLITVVAGNALAVNCTGRTGNPADTLLVFPFVLSTGNTGIATVESPSENPAQVRGIAAGNTLLTCELAFGTHATDTVRVTVTAAPLPVATVTVTPNPVSVTVGSTQQMTATTRDAGGNVLTGRAVTWSTSSATSAVVSSTGLVTGFAVGSVTITATSEGMSGTAIVNVTAVATTGGISGVVQNATNGLPLSGALVEVRAGSATTGTTAAPSVTTTSTGAFAFANLAPGAYTVMATATGYASVNVAVVVTAGQTKSVTIALPPVSAGISIVLTWGAIPNDLDSYLYLPASVGGGTISYYNLGSCSASPFACLVNDETSPNSSEYTNITQLVSGTYTFRVNDYVNSTNNALTSTDLSRSSARVEVFVGGVLQRTFTVPNLAGVTWTVFDLSGSIAAPTITARNEMAAALPPEFTASAVRSASKALLKVRKTP